MATHFDSLDEVRAAVGRELGTSGWLSVDQDRISRFADVTEDHQWIHVDAERAAREGPFGSTVAHGYLTLSLVSRLIGETVSFSGVTFAVNYGTNKVRFPAPVRVGSRIRGRTTLAAVEEIPGGIQTIIAVTVEVEGQDKPGCFAEIVSRFYT